MKHKQYFISEETGKLLEKLIILNKSKSILEIGTGEGYSTIFLAKGAKKNNGKVISIEIYDKGAKKAVKNIKEAGLSEFVEVINGAALDVLNKLKGKFDFVFIDEGEKENYLADLKAVLKKLDKKCVIAAHNVISHKQYLQDYLDFVRKNFESRTIAFDSGIEISVKKSLFVFRNECI